MIRRFEYRAGDVYDLYGPLFRRALSVVLVCAGRRMFAVQESYESALVREAVSMSPTSQMICLASHDFGIWSGRAVLLLYYTS